MNEEKKFTYLDSKQIEHTVTFEENDFELVQEGKKLHDEKFHTKPTTFFKDAMKRFAKNKSSVVGAVILGTIVLMAIVVPIVDRNDISSSHAAESKLEPKLFPSGTGWWDGCRDVKHVAFDTDWEAYEESGGTVVQGMPADYVASAVVGGADGVKVDEVSYIYNVNPYGHGGYTRVSLVPGGTAEFCSWNGHTFDFSGTRVYTLEITTVDPTTNEDWNFGAVAPTYAVYFNWTDPNDESLSYSYPLGEEAAIGDKKTFTFSHDDLATVDPNVGRLNASSAKPYLSVKIPSIETGTNNLVIEKLLISSSNENENEELKNMSIIDANKTLSIVPKNGDGTYNKYYWTTLNGSHNLYRAKLFYCSFRYDTYEVAFGEQTASTSIDALRQWNAKGWLNADFTLADNLASIPYSQRQARADQFIASLSLTEEGKLHCPLLIDDEHTVTAAVRSAGGVVAIEITGTISRWKQYYPDRNSAPIYLMGTDAMGRDMVKLVFSGLRTSLLLGLITAAVTFAFGLVWGAIAGYFGGWVDILMERFTDLLGGVPWIVVMTLAIVRFGSSFGVFIAALCLTGWIGTASLTRTQFYRYKNREYILAARTLGASDMRLIFRHILPNAVGTIVTSSVFMISSVIYSESSIAYLNLGLTGMDSFGVILADNQAYITSFPHLILFPSIIMLFLMISFNLFGNGLRDAFNPSLKGQE